MKYYTYHNGILCISKPGLTDGNAMASDAKLRPIASEAAYEKYVARNKNVRVRMGKGLNCPALLSWQLLRADWRQMAELKYGSPEQKTTILGFEQYIQPDAAALKYFNDYILADGRELPEDAKREYYANAIVLNGITAAKRRIGGAHRKSGHRSSVWRIIAADIAKLDKDEYPHTLPENDRSLQRKYADYLNEGYQLLIHRNYCNAAAEKINEDAKMWVLARWANQVTKVATIQQLLCEYNAKAVVEDWKQLKSEVTLRNFLFSEDVQNLWWGHRYGELKAKEKFSFQFSTRLPSYRDSLWYSDGTKLNYFYLTDDGKVATCQVYEVMDACSEVFLGYHISNTEDFVAQHAAYKMALKTSGHKPYQVTFDNQGGHKKLEVAEFFKNLAHLAIKTAPYNGKSKTIESAFGRFQDHYLKRDWYFTGQNIQTVRLESKANMEYINANKANLPTLAEVKDTYLRRRTEWNNAPHPKAKNGESRLQVYYSSVNPQAVKCELWDMVNLFWVLRDKPVTVNAYGISFDHKRETYTYMKYEDNNSQMPDIDWLADNVGKKLFVKFDPEDMSMIFLYEKDHNGLRFVAEAETKWTIARGKQEQEDGEMKLTAAVNARRKEKRVGTTAIMDEILASHNLLPEQHGFNSPSIKGINSKRIKKQNDDYGKVLKKEANMIADCDGNMSDAELLHSMI